MLVLNPVQDRGKPLTLLLPPLPLGGQSNQLVKLLRDFPVKKRVKALSQEANPARKSESHQVRFHHPKLPHRTKSSLWALSPRIETWLMLILDYDPRLTELPLA